MRTPNPATMLAAALAMVLGASSAADAASTPPEPVDTPDRPAARPLQPDPLLLKKKPIKRRAVQQRVESVNRIPVVTEGYRPTLNPAPRTAVTGTLPAPAPYTPGATLSPPPPAQVNSCVGNGCNDTSGARYTGGVGNTVLDQNGRNCTRTGTTIQCF